MLEVIAVGHGRHVAENLRFGNLCDEERMRAVIVRVNNLCGDKCIRSERDIGKPVSAACSVCFKTGKLVRIFTACKAKPLEGIKRSVFCKNGQIEDSAFQNHIMRVVCFVYSDVDSARRACELCSRVDNAAIIFAVGLRGQHEKSVGELVEDRRVDFQNILICFANYRLFKTRNGVRNCLNQSVDFIGLFRFQGRFQSQRFV